MEYRKIALRSFLTLWGGLIQLTEITMRGLMGVRRALGLGPERVISLPLHRSSIVFSLFPKAGRIRARSHRFLQAVAKCGDERTCRSLPKALADTHSK